MDFNLTRKPKGQLLLGASRNTSMRKVHLGAACECEFILMPPGCQNSLNAGFIKMDTECWHTMSKVVGFNKTRTDVVIGKEHLHSTTQPHKGAE